MSKSSKVPLFERFNSFQKLLICIVLGVVAFFIFQIKDIDALSHFMIGWDTFSLCMILMGWTTFFITDSTQIRAQAKIQDPNRPIIFMIVLIATVASFLAVLLLLVSKKNGDGGAPYRIPIAITGMIFSWFLIHTTFALRYAHIYYGDHKTKINTHAAGLEFPEDNMPEYLDFAYFSFVLGMTFQVSDVQVTSKRLRKLVMLHGLLSFGFNTVMIALTINLIAGFG
ncbi:MAG: DUF1345 domain-containing protein [Ginsengibacter sp.]